MTWTSAAPTKPGWYWWRANKKKAEPFIVHLGLTMRDIEGPEELCTDYCEDQETPKDMGGQWSSGPLEPPEDGQ